MRRVVFDTNTAVSALLWRGVSYTLFRAMRRQSVPLFSPPFLLDELAAVLSRPKFDSLFASRKTSRPEVVRKYTALASLVFPGRIPDVITDDPTDNHVLACAVAANADVIVSGDRHLLSVGEYAGARIVPAGFLLAQLVRVR